MKYPTSAVTSFHFNDRLDTQYLESIYNGDTVNAAYIFQLFLSELPETLTGITEGVKTNDKKALFELIHKTKTSFSFVGLTYITPLMEGVERECLRAHNTAELTGSIDHLIDEINRTEPIIKEEYARLTAYSNNLVENQVHHS